MQAQVTFSKCDASSGNTERLSAFLFAFIISAFSVLFAVRNTFGDDYASELTKGIPSDAIEIKSDTQFLFAKGVGPESLKLGKLETGKMYWARIHFINMFDLPFHLEKIHSSCGCLAAARSNDIIKPRGKSFFVVLIKPQLKDVAYAKSVTITSDRGDALQILITADFEQPFELVERVIRLGNAVNDSKVPLTVKCKGMSWSDSKIEIESSTGHTRILGVEKVPTLDEWKLAIEIPEESRRLAKSGLRLTEIFTVKDQSSNKLVCELEFSVEDSSSFICKPSTVKLALTEDGWVGKATLFGDWQSLEFDGKKLPVEASDKEKNVINGEARIIRSIGRVTSIELHFGHSKPTFGQSFSATLRCGEKEICDLKELLFIGGK